jgi:hypothetical protein
VIHPGDEPLFLAKWRRGESRCVRTGEGGNCRRVSTQPTIEHRETKPQQTRPTILLKLPRPGHAGQVAYNAWQEPYGIRVGQQASGMCTEMLRRPGLHTGGILIDAATQSMRWNRFYHGCGCIVKQPLAQHWHHGACGLHVLRRSHDRVICPAYDSPGKVRRRTCRLRPRTKEGQSVPCSIGVPCARVRLPAQAEQGGRMAGPTRTPLLSMGESSDISMRKREISLAVELSRLSD